MAAPSGRSSFRNSILRGRRAETLAALGTSMVLVATLVVGPTIAAPYPSRPIDRAMRDGPPLGHTGGFREPTCEQCHWGDAVNDPAGSLAIEGLPARFRPGGRYVLTVTLRRPGIAVAGFQLTTRYEDGGSVGKQAGSLRGLDPRTTITRNDTTGVLYAHHTRPGTTLTEPGVGRWTVEWTAPAVPLGAVVVHVASNAGDDNDSPSGDYVYTKSAKAASTEK